MDPLIKQKILGRRGLDPSQYDVDESTGKIYPIEQTQEPPTAASDTAKSSALGAAIKHGLYSLPEAGGGLAGMGVGAWAGAPFAPFTAGLSIPAGALLGGFGGGAGVGYLKNLAANKFAPELARSMEESAAEHPYASFVGQMGSMLLGAKPNVGNVIKGIPQLWNPLGLANAARTPGGQHLINAALGAGLGGGIEAGTELYNEGKIDPAKVLMAGGAGGVLSAPNRVGTWLSRGAFSPVVDTDAAINAARAKDLTGGERGVFQNAITEDPNSYNQYQKEMNAQIRAQIEAQKAADEYRQLSNEAYAAEPPMEQTPQNEAPDLTGTADRAEAARLAALEKQQAEYKAKAEAAQQDLGKQSAKLPIELTEEGVLNSERAKNEQAAMMSSRLAMQQRAMEENAARAAQAEEFARKMQDPEFAAQQAASMAAKGGAKFEQPELKVGDNPVEPTKRTGPDYDTRTEADRIQAQLEGIRERYQEGPEVGAGKVTKNYQDLVGEMAKKHGQDVENLTQVEGGKYAGKMDPALERPLLQVAKNGGFDTGPHEILHGILAQIDKNGTAGERRFAARVRAALGEEKFAQAGGKAFAERAVGLDKPGLIKDLVSYLKYRWLGNATEKDYARLGATILERSAAIQGKGATGSVKYQPLFDKDVSVAGADLRRFIKLTGQTMYGDSLGSTVGKEAMQNAIDAAREKGPNTKVTIANHGPYFHIIDDGIGMSPETVVEKFLPAAVTGKDAKVSGGGFGMSKIAQLGSTKNFKLESVGQRPDGSKYKTTVDGTSDDWINFATGHNTINYSKPYQEVAGLKIHIEKVSNDTDTGTRLRININDTEDAARDARWAAKSLSSRITDVDIGRG